MDGRLTQIWKDQETRGSHFIASGAACDIIILTPGRRREEKNRRKASNGTQSDGKLPPDSDLVANADLSRTNLRIGTSGVLFCNCLSGSRPVARISEFVEVEGLCWTTVDIAPGYLKCYRGTQRRTGRTCLCPVGNFGTSSDGLGTNAGKSRGVLWEPRMGDRDS